MARSVVLIQSQMEQNLQSGFNALNIPIDITTWSKRNIFRLICNVMAIAISLLEQVIDLFKETSEATAAAAAPATPAWLQKKILEFQYDANDPQVIQYTAGGAPYYPTVDTTKRIITRCSVITSTVNKVLVKVAKGDIPGQLASPELSALQAYVLPPNGLGIAGVDYVITSGNSDKLYIDAYIYFAGQYAGVIQANVIAAINSFLANQSSQANFNGIIKLSDLELAIRSVTGVNDVVFKNVSARADGTSYGSGTFLVQNSQVIIRQWPTVSGYIVSETASGHTLSDSLTFIPE